MSDSGRELQYNDMLNLLNDLAKQINIMDQFNQYAIYLVGGAAMVLYYQCRLSSKDIDVSWLGNPKVINKAVLDVAKFYGVNKQWLNKDYEKSSSYTDKIFSNSIVMSRILNTTFYVAKPELILCMKLISFRTRTDKHDLDDVKNIIHIMQNNGYTVDMENVIDWIDYYFPDAELKPGALNYIRQLGG